MPLLAVVAVLLGAALVLAPQLLAGSADTPARKASATGNLQLSTAVQPTPEPADDMASASAPQGFAIEAAGIDVEVLPLTPTAADLQNQSLVPPYTEDGYWLTPYGSPGEGSENTTYITGHSWDGREAPFDRLSTHTEVGDAITVTTATGTLHYVVDKITTYNKNTLKDSEIWNIIPNRLVLISCYTADPTGKNVVVTASPAPTPQDPQGISEE